MIKISFPNQIKIFKFQFFLESQNKLFLSEFQGASLRGGFGYAFKTTACLEKGKGLCSSCQRQGECVYGYIFETTPAQDSAYLRKLNDIPRPFVIEPPDDSKRFYDEHEVFAFNLILIGRAAEYLPYFIFAFKQLGMMGLGRNRGKYILSKVLDERGKEIFNEHDDVIRHNGYHRRLSDSNEEIKRIRIKFMTPTRIKINKDLVVKPSFNILVKALLHRISALSYFHCGVKLELDYRKLIDLAGTIKQSEMNVRWMDWKRYSTRQKTSMNLGGFTGDAVYEGDLGVFMPLLYMGEKVHVGKNCTFGLGKYEIVEEGKA